MPILETQDLTYVYGAGTPFEKTAVDHISLQIEEGEAGWRDRPYRFRQVYLCAAAQRPSEANLRKGAFKGKGYLGGAKENQGHPVPGWGWCSNNPEHQLFEETVEKDIAFGPKNMGLSEEEIKRRVKNGGGFRRAEG